MERPDLQGHKAALKAGNADLRAARTLATEVLTAHSANGWVPTDQRVAELWEAAGLPAPTPGEDADITIVCSCGWQHEGGFNALREHQADMLAKAGLLIWNRAGSTSP
jgi:rhodanese-related sulfurtransferase